MDGEKELIVDPGTAESLAIDQLLVGAIVPRPIAFVSTVSAAGVLNLAAFSFFTAVSANPPVICFSPMIRRDGSKKDTLRNIEETGEFVVNIVSEEFKEKMNLTAPEYPPDTDEFAISGLTPRSSDLVKPPRVAESHIQMECRLLQVVHVSPLPRGGSLVLGEVLRFHVDDAVLTGNRIDPDKLHAIGRMGGPQYVRTTDRFEMLRPGS
ncbi:MAG TPA: flavin reductase family protein [Candidatus Sulfopaludibacter sp.]|nr:flavin reductase family protein [Candidatus Sulfopaludibacter sp.]